MEYLTDQQVIERAGKWHQFYLNPKTRAKMDDVMSDLNPIDQRRVRLCGQRMADGQLPIKVIPTPDAVKFGESKKKEQHEQNATTNKRQRAASANGSTHGAKTKTPVGSNIGATKGNHARSRASRKK